MQAVLRIVRVRSREGRPVSCVTMYTPPELAPLLTPQAITQTSVLALLERGGVRISQADQSIFSCLADAHVAPLLDEPMGAALLSVMRLMRDGDGRPVAVAARPVPAALLRPPHGAGPCRRRQCAHLDPARHHDLRAEGALCGGRLIATGTPAEVRRAGQPVTVLVSKNSAMPSGPNSRPLPELL